MGVREFWFWDSFVLQTRTFHEGGVMIRWFGSLGRLWRLACHAILGGVGMVALRGQFSKKCCCGSVQYGFYGDLDCVHLLRKW